MNRKAAVKSRLGLTLIELIVVVAILAIIAMIVIPNLDRLKSSAGHGVGAVSADDTGRYIQIYKVSTTRYPDGWDSLMDSAGTDLWDASDISLADPRGLHRQLSGSGSANKLTTYTLVDADVTALKNAGIFTLYGYGGPNVTTTTRAGDMFNVPTPLATGGTVAIVNAASSGGKKMIDHIYRDNAKTGGVSGTIPAGKKLIVFGFGPHNKMVGTSMTECPSYPPADPYNVYNRNLCIFEVGTSCVLKAVVGADGDLIDDMTAQVSRDP